MFAAGVKWTVVFLAALILQTTLVPVIGIAGVKPDLVIIALFLLSIKFGVLPGLYAGFLIGLGQDLYSPSILGQNALAKTVTGFFIGLFNERFMRTDPLMKIIILMLSFLVHDAVFTLALIVKTESGIAQLIPELFSQTLPRTIYSAVIASLIYLWDHIVKPSFQS
jgi:rod shape-determining protein MreD